MAQLIVKRKKAVVDRNRNYSVFLDGDKIALIPNGEELTFNINPGKHIISAKVDWNSSNAIVFEVQENDTIHFTLSTANPFSAIYYTLVKPNKYLKFKLHSITK
ncbi:MULTISPECIES: hypothetical protein [Myroides]|uniref:hypothetical protein n=1 Tax=Myroides TaxID=76831 RepID=UPI001302EBC4|nr:hypothetical protein [Myroides phaeus]